MKKFSSKIRYGFKISRPKNYFNFPDIIEESMWTMKNLKRVVKENWKIISIISLVLSILAFAIADRINLIELKEYGTISNKKYTEEYETVYYDSETNIPYTTYYPEEFTISVNYNGQHFGSKNVNEGFYERVKRGDNVLIYYSIGRYTGHKYIHDMELSTNIEQY